jgi:hypothetical protein
MLPSKTGAVGLDSSPDRSDRTFDEWVVLATGQPNSPAEASLGDRTLNWVAPDKRSVHLVVKVPHPPAHAATVTLENVPTGADARPYFENALARVKAQNAGLLVIPKGTYVFKTVNAEKLGHLVLKDLTDLTINGGGSTFVFTQNENGIYLTSNQRIKLTGITIEYSLHMASLGQIHATQDGNQLVIDPRFPVNETDVVYYLSEFDPGSNNWPTSGQRVIMPPGSPAPARYIGNQTYASTSFKQLKPGTTFVVFHHWYGGVAVKIADLPSPPVSEDLTFDGLTIHSGPGMGILAYGMKRGLAIVNSNINPGSDPLKLISTEYDAIHLLVTGGDVIVDDNHISGQGDDAINFNNPMQPVVAGDGNSSKITLSAYSRFIQPGDTLAFFDPDVNFIGKTNVVGTKALGGLNYEIVMASAIPGLTTQTVVRDLQLINSRYAIERNEIKNCHCHGILLQTPFGLVDHNTISGISGNAIRLLTNVDSFKEGVGALDVIVRENTISNTGTDSGIKMRWAAISAYGGVRNNTVSPAPVNSDIEILGNRISNVQQGCITVMSSRKVRISDNNCETNGGPQASLSAITVSNSSKIVLTKNRSSGFARVSDVETASTHEVQENNN